MKKLNFLLPIFLLEILAIFSLVSRVQAGNGRQQLIPTTPLVTPEKHSIPKNTGMSSIAKPLSWEKPYWLNNTICRERQSNIICLNSEEAEKLRWPIPISD